MSETEPQEQVDVVEEVLGAVRDKMTPDLANSGVGPDVSMGRLFLGLIQNPAYIQTYSERDENNRLVEKKAVVAMEAAELTAGALGAYNGWVAEERRRIERDDPEQLAGAADPEAFIREQVTARMIAQLDHLNGANPITDGAKEKIAELLQGGPGAFEEAITTNAATLKTAMDAHLEAINAAKAQGKPEPAMGIVGILAVLDATNDDGQSSGLNRVDVGDVEISPQAQAETSMRGAFEAMSDFVTHGNGSEIFLARLHGIDEGGHSGMDYSNWMQYDNITRIRGLHEGFGSTQAIDEFTSDAGLSAAGNYSLSVGGAGGPANMDRLFTQALVDRGLVSFGEEGATPEQVAAARADWNEHMAEGLKAGLGKSPDHLMAHMQEFAANRRDMTMTTEPVESRNNGLTAAEVRGQFIPDAPLETEGTLETDAPLETEGTIETIGTAGPVEIEDPVGAEGATAFLAGEAGIGPLVANTVDARIAQLESVPGFQAAMRAYEQGQSVPDFSPLAQLGGNDLSADLLGPRIQQ